MAQEERIHCALRSTVLRRRLLCRASRERMRRTSGFGRRRGSRATRWWFRARRCRIPWRCAMPGRMRRRGIFIIRRAFRRGRSARMRSRLILGRPGRLRGRGGAIQAKKISHQEHKEHQGRGDCKRRLGACLDVYFTVSEIAASLHSSMMSRPKCFWMAGSMTRS